MPPKRIPAESNTDRLRIALGLQAAGIDMMRQNLRRRHPDASDNAIEAMLLEWLGREPGDGLAAVQGFRERPL